LAEKKVLPNQHFVDKGYVHAEMLAKSQQIHQIDILGPALPDTSWSSKDVERFDQSEFSIDWELKSVLCPAGHKSRDWGNIPDRHGKPSLRIRFPLPVCRSCPLHDQCTQSAAKVLILRPDKQSYLALQENRKRQETPEFRALYAKRAGVEGTVARVRKNLRDTEITVYWAEKAESSSISHCYIDECPSSLSLGNRRKACNCSFFSLCKVGGFCSARFCCLASGHSPTIS
jgi:hypothetical protein